ncbi:competence type IV pilus minor pilin ComGD [Salipaludibacillus neizhouensis]|nr:competence type IV pilus minor pilin ComGD [Salipaludibacillus neizhouensis]
MKNGFTFIEMLIVLVIISLLLLISLPTFQGAMEETEFEYFLKEMEQDLHYYQMYAMTNGKGIRFNFATDGSTYQVMDGLNVLFKKETPDGTAFLPRTLLLNELRFLPNGNISKAGIIEIQFNDERCHLIFQLVRGRFYFEKF